MVSLGFGLDDWDIEVMAFPETTVVSATTTTKYGLTIAYTPLLMVANNEQVTVETIKDTIARREALAGGLL